MRGERDAGHKGIREMGNMDPDTEITFQFRANQQDAGGEKKTCNSMCGKRRIGKQNSKIGPIE